MLHPGGGSAGDSTQTEAGGRGGALSPCTQLLPHTPIIVPPPLTTHQHHLPTPQHCTQIGFLLLYLYLRPQPKQKFSFSSLSLSVFLSLSLPHPVLLQTGSGTGSWEIFFLTEIGKFCQAFAQTSLTGVIRNYVSIMTATILVLIRLGLMRFLWIKQIHVFSLNLKKLKNNFRFYQTP